MASVLLVEDDASLREVLAMFLRKQGHEVAVASSFEEGLSLVNDASFDLVLTDLKLGQKSGLDILSHVKREQPETEVIVITAYSTVETAIEAMKGGAFDYVGKPFKLEEIAVTIEKALEKRALSLENITLRRALLERYRFDQIIGKTPKMQQIFETIARVAPTKTSVLITGESGTGKELVARAIHFNSARKTGPFVVVNCAAIPDTLMESELFGHVKGAFTGAHTSKRGLLETANGGTVFLDEIGELSLAMQVKLLRFLQEHTIRAVGSTKEVKVDVRVVAATNKDLVEAVRAQRFREDLFYRLNVVHINMPPLRERREDIPYLASHFLEKFRKELSKDVRGFAPDVMERLMSWNYKGNVRELENIIEHAVTFATGPLVTMDALPEHLKGEKASPLSAIDQVTKVEKDGVDMESVLAEVERRLLVNALSQAKGVKKDAAALLNISFRSFRYKLAKYGLAPTPTSEELEQDE